MGGRATPKYVFFEGGPLDGQRHMTPAGLDYPPTITHFEYPTRPTATAGGTRIDHTYRLADRVQVVNEGPWKFKCRVAVYEKALPPREVGPVKVEPPPQGSRTP